MTAPRKDAAIVVQPRAGERRDVLSPRPLRPGSIGYLTSDLRTDQTPTASGMMSQMSPEVPS